MICVDGVIGLGGGAEGPNNLAARGVVRSKPSVQCSGKNNSRYDARCRGLRANTHARDVVFGTVTGVVTRCVGRGRLPDDLASKRVECRQARRTVAGTFNGCRSIRAVQVVQLIDVRVGNKDIAVVRADAPFDATQRGALSDGSSPKGVPGRWVQ